MDIPKIDEILARLQTSKIFTRLDLISGYYHIKCRHKSAFTTIFGKYEFLGMSFGLAQGLAYITTLIQKVLGTFNVFISFTWMIY